MRRLHSDPRKGLNMKDIHNRSDTPLKIHMEHNHGGLEDHVPFQMGDL